MPDLSSNMYMTYRHAIREALYTWTRQQGHSGAEKAAQTYTHDTGAHLRTYLDSSISMPCPLLQQPYPCGYFPTVCGESTKPLSSSVTKRFTRRLVSVGEDDNAWNGENGCNPQKLKQNTLHDCTEN